MGILINLEGDGGCCAYFGQQQLLEFGLVGGDVGLACGSNFAIAAECFERKLRSAHAFTIADGHVGSPGVGHTLFLALEGDGKFAIFNIEGFSFNLEITAQGAQNFLRYGLDTQFTTSHEQDCCQREKAYM